MFDKTKIITVERFINKEIFENNKPDYVIEKV